MAITQALTSSVATAGFSAPDHRTEDRLLELLTVAEPGSWSAPYPVVLEQTRANGIRAGPKRRSLWRNSTLIG